MKQAYGQENEVLAEEAFWPEDSKAGFEDVSGASSVPCGLAIGSLVMGIASFVTGPLTGIPSIICGHIGLIRIHRSGGTMTGKGMAIAGLVMSYVSQVIFLAIVFAFVLPVEEQRLTREVNRVLHRRELPPKHVKTALPPYSAPLPDAAPPSLFPAPRRNAPVQNTAGQSAVKPDHARQIKKNEAAVVAVLQETVLAQKAFHRQNGRYVANFKELRIPSIQDNAYAGYTFKIMALSSSFRVTADPIIRRETGTQSFYVDASGVIRFNPSGKATAADPALN